MSGFRGVGRTLWLVLVGVAPLGAAGCDGGRQLLNDGQPSTLVMDMSTPPFFVGEEGDAVYLVETRIELPLAPPTTEEMQELGVSAPPPFPRQPWVARGDYELQVEWVLSNLSDTEINTTLVVNGFSEFTEYVPGVGGVDDEVELDFSQWQKAYTIGPFERRRGTIREQELDEVAVDLATVINPGAPDGNQVVYFDNQSGFDPRIDPFIPEVIPALTGMRIGLITGSPIPLLLEATVRVRDVEGRLVGDPAEAWVLPTPTPFVPSVAAAAVP